MTLVAPATGRQSIANLGRTGRVCAPRVVAHIVAASLALIAILCHGTTAMADRPGGVSAQTVTLPSGPSSLKGLGSSFEPNLGSGTGGYSVPLELPPGFLPPVLEFDYVGGRGKGVLGQSWSLPVLQIFRQTDKGSPEFDEQDRFAVMGAGLNDELVRVNAKLGYYRLKNEGAFALFVRDAASDSWTVRFPKGQTAYLGTSLASRQTARGRSYRWLLDKQTDRFGHWTDYDYFTDAGQIYLNEVRYQQHAASAYQNAVTFSYAPRPDVFTDYTYGAACTTSQRLESVQVFHGARLVRTYRLGYRAGLLYSLLSSVDMQGEDGLSLPRLSFDYLAESAGGGRLTTFKNVPPLDGLIEGWAELEDVNADGLPDLLTGKSGDYRYYENLDGRSFGDAKRLQNSPDHALDEAGVVVADLNGDGFRDLLHSQGDHFRYYPGGDISAGVFKGYGKPSELSSSSDSFFFTDAEVKLSDQNGDGRIDLLWQKPGQDGWLLNGKDNVLREQPVAELPSDVDFDDPLLSFADFNGDGLADLIRKEIGFESSRLRVWFGLGHGEYLSEIVIGGIPKGDPAEFYLQDVNHDAQLDLLRISGTWATAYLNLGTFAFSGARGSFDGLPATSQTTKLLFADMNGNGTVDVVWVTADFKLHYLELSSEPKAGLLSRIDNGMGFVTDVAYRMSTEYAIDAKAAGRPWVHPSPLAVPVISEIRTTDSLDVLGLDARESRTSYDYRDAYYDGKEHEFRGFGEVTTSSWGDANHETLITRTKLSVGRNPTTLADEEILKGRPYFQVESDELGNVYSAVETKWEKRWLCQEDLGNGDVILPQCKQLGQLDDKKDQLVAVAVSPAAFTAVYEKTNAPRFTASVAEFDAWGNPSKVTDYGEVGYVGAYVLGGGFEVSRIQGQVGDDEKVTTSAVINDISNWLIGLPSENALLDLKGTVFARSRNYYDGLAFGKVTRGLNTRIAEYDSDRKVWIDSKLTEYDSHGKPTAIVNAVGDRTELSYEPNGNLLPNQERVSLGAGDWLVFNADYDLAHGSVIRSVDANGHEWRAELDGLGRVSRTFDPGGALPTAKYEYTFGTPASPVSVTHEELLVERAGRYHSSWDYSDGTGQVRQHKETAEAPFGYIASGWVRMSSRGSPAVQSEPFATGSLGLEAPPLGTPVTRVKFDAGSRPTRSEQAATSDLPAGSFSTLQYYPLESRSYSEKENAAGDLRHPIITRFDGQGRMVEVRKLNRQRDDEQDMSWKIGYDPRGSITSLADPMWRSAADDARHLRRYSYDGRGRLKTVQDPNAGRTDYKSDDLGRMIQRTDALGHSQRWTYGAAGRLMSHHVGGGSQSDEEYEHQYHYDEPAPGSPLGNTTSANLRGRLSWVEFPTGEEHYGYDVLGRVQEDIRKLWDPATSSFEQQQRSLFRRAIEYRADGSIAKNTLPGGLALSYSYNERQRTQTLSATLAQVTKPILTSAGYDESGEEIAADLGNGIRACNAFNQRRELVSALAGKASELSCQQPTTAFGGFHNLRYLRGFDGLITSIEDRSTHLDGVPRLDAIFEYDSIQQLLGRRDAQGSTSFTYDIVQNLVGREIVGGIADQPTGAFSYGEGEAGPNAITHAGGIEYTYDAVGQMQRYNGYDLRFNAEGQLVEANNTETGVRLVQYYDDTGERRLALVYRRGKPVVIHRFVAPDYQIRDGEEVWFAGASLARTEIVRSQGVLIDAYLLDEISAYANGQRLGLKPLPAEYMDLNGDGRELDADDVALAQQAFASEQRVGGAKLISRFTTGDHLGSVSQVTDSVGDVVSYQRFHEYGKLASRTGERAYHGGFIGKDIEADSDLGLQRVGARYYAPELGRWISPDPLIGQDPNEMVGSLLESNLYSYGRNNPLMFIDHTGHDVNVVGKDSDKVMAHLANTSGLPFVRDNKKGTVSVAVGPPAPGHEDGAAMVRNLIDKKGVSVDIYGITPKEPGDHSGTTPMDVEEAIDGKPTNVVIKLDLRNDTGTLYHVKDGQGTRLEKADPTIGLAHELGHATTMVEGHLQPGVTDRSYVDENGNTQTERLKHEEVKAMYHENKVRAELGKPERVAYDYVLQKQPAKKSAPKPANKKPTKKPVQKPVKKKGK